MLAGTESVSEKSCLDRLFSFSKANHERNADAHTQGRKHRIQMDKHTRPSLEIKKSLSHSSDLLRGITVWLSGTKKGKKVNNGPKSQVVTIVVAFFDTLYL